MRIDPTYVDVNFSYTKPGGEVEIAVKLKEEELYPELHIKSKVKTPIHDMQSADLKDILVRRVGLAKLFTKP